MADLLHRVKQAEDRIRTRYQRMDGDWGRYLLDEFVLRDTKSRKIPDAYSVTLNDPRTFADRVISVLASAMPRPEVEGENLPDDYATFIEEWWKDVVYTNDQRRMRLHQQPLHLTSCSDVALRGWIARRALVWHKEGKEAIFDILPCDPRYVSFEMGDEGLLMAAYRSEQSAEYVTRKYGVTTKSETVSMIDAWDDEVNEVYVEGKLVQQEPNPYGYPPFVIYPVQLIPPRGRNTDETIKYYGDSIYGPGRDVADKKNAIASIALTLAYRDFRSPLALKGDGKMIDESPYQDGIVMSLDKEESLEPIPYGDLRAAVGFVWNIIDNASQRGAFVYSEWGDIPFELSAIAIEKLEGHRDQVFIPRIQAINLANRETAHMLLEQFKMYNLPARLGRSGGHVYKPSDFKHDFTITFHMSTTSPEKSIANYSVANAASSHISSDTILRDILQVENPEQENVKVREEKVTAMVPHLELVRRYQDIVREIKKTKDPDVKRGLALEAKLIEAALAGFAGEEEGGGGELPGGSKAQAMPSAEVPGPQSMTAEQQIEREEMRRQGVPVERGDKTGRRGA